MLASLFRPAAPRRPSSLLTSSGILPALLRSAQTHPGPARVPTVHQFYRSISSRYDMSRNISVHFLGTTSGGGPTETRNCSSLVVDPFGGSGQLWMVDCAEGTVRQFEKQPYRPGQQRLRIGQVSKIFITHMHADHTMGLLTFLRNTLGIPKPPGTGPANAPPPNQRRPRVEIYGPRGVRRMLRMLWHMTHSRSEFAYAAHELLFDGEQPSIAADVHDGQEGVDEADVRSESECVGRDIWCDEQGFWKGIVDMTAKQTHGLWGAVVDAGPIQHRDPCIGYVMREIPRYPLTVESPMPRKLVILGDTYDPSPIVPLVHADGPSSSSSANPPSAPSSSEASTSSSPTHEPAAAPHIDFSALPVVNPHDNGVCVRVPVSLLVHEATDAYLPPHVDPQQRTGKNRTAEGVAAKAVLRGHSTPAMAGAFARTVAAERLVLNHLGARFPAPDMEHNQYHGGGRNQFRVACMREIERQAAEAWNPNPGRRMQPYVQAAWDFLTVSVPPNEPRSMETPASEDENEDEDEDERGHGTRFAARTASTGRREQRQSNGDEPGGSNQHQQIRRMSVDVDVDNGDRKRRAPASDGAGSPRGGGSGGGRGRGGDHHHRGGSSTGGSGRGAQNRHQDRGRKPRTSDHARRGRGGSVS